MRSDVLPTLSLSLLTSNPWLTCKSWAARNDIVNPRTRQSYSFALVGSPQGTKKKKLNVSITIPQHHMTICTFAKSHWISLQMLPYRSFWHHNCKRTVATRQSESQGLVIQHLNQSCSPGLLMSFALACDHVGIYVGIKVHFGEHLSFHATSSAIISLLIEVWLPILGHSGRRVTKRDKTAQRTAPIWQCTFTV